MSRLIRPAMVAPALVALVAMAPAAHAQPAITWDPASSHNYTAMSSRSINSIVIHKAEGSLDGTVSWFKNSASKVSAHYVVDDNRIVQCVKDKDRAWHAGNSYYNLHAIGIENSGYTNRNDMTDGHYRRLAQLVAYLCKKYGIPMDRSHVIGHNEVPDPNHAGRFGGSGNHDDPGPYWNWTLFMNYVRQYAGQPAVAPTPSPVPPPAPAPSPRLALSGAATTADVNVRDSAWGTILQTVPAQSGWVRTGDDDQGFAEVYFSGRRGFISMNYLGGYSGTGAKVTASSLNVRSASSMSGAIVGAVFSGQSYVSGGDSADGAWTLIRYDSNRRWVYKSYTTAVALK